jgi:NAD(P)-dependent dehydrogenase (short-subunit alcohol dehydrogenase family)
VSTLVVTGSSSGIGEACVVRLARARMALSRPDRAFRGRAYRLVLSLMGVTIATTIITT